MLSFFQSILKFFKALEPKTLLIIVFVILFLVFFGMWYFDGSHHKDEINQLHVQNKELVEKGNQISKQLDSLRKVNKVLILDKTDIETQLTKTEVELQKALDKASKSGGDLNKANAERERILKQIEELKKNPANRQDDELIKSLRKKLNK